MTKSLHDGTEFMKLAEATSEILRLRGQLDRANKIIGWMMPYIGNMCPPDGGLGDLNEHCFYNRVPEPGKETKGAALRQRS